MAPSLDYLHEESRDAVAHLLRFVFECGLTLDRFDLYPVIRDPSDRRESKAFWQMICLSTLASS